MPGRIHQNHVASLQHTVKPYDEPLESYPCADLLLISHDFCKSYDLVGGLNPSEKYEFVSWGYFSQYMESHKIHVPNHQPVKNVLPINTAERPSMSTLALSQGPNRSFPSDFRPVVRCTTVSWWFKYQTMAG